MVLKKEWFRVLPAILLVAAIGFSPSFSAGKLPDGKVVEIRAEDILLLVLGLAWIANFFITKRRSIERPPLFLPIIAWLTVVLISTLTNLLFSNLELQRGFFYTLKEIEFFFIYFYLFYHLKSREAIHWIVKLWIAVGAVHIGWILFQIVFGLKITYHYSYTTFIEPEGSSPGGGFLLLIFAFLLNVFLYHSVRTGIPLWQKGLLLIAIFLPVVGIWTSGSRAVLLGFFVTLSFAFLLYALRKRMVLPVLLLLWVVFLGGSVLVWQLHRDNASRGVSLVSRYLDLERFVWEFNPENPSSRASIWKQEVIQLAEQPALLLFGHGKSAQLGDQPHNYYLQVLRETGIVGILVFAALMGTIIKLAWQGFVKSQGPFIIGLSAGLLTVTVAILILSITGEAFQVVKIAEPYWAFTALAMAALYTQVRTEK